MDSTAGSKLSGADWPEGIYRAFKGAGIRQVAYVPDAGHSALIQRCHADNEMRTVVLTTEEEGVAMLAGAWLGGDKGALLMQSSGVGNCINMLSLARSCRMPLVMLVTMRGEWAEFNPWQLPMGQATPAVLEAAGVTVYRVDDPEKVADTVESALDLAVNAGITVAVLLSQSMIGRKKW